MFQLKHKIIVRLPLLTEQQYCLQVGCLLIDNHPMHLNQQMMKYFLILLHTETKIIQSYLEIIHTQWILNNSCNE